MCNEIKWDLKNEDFYKAEIKKSKGEKLYNYQINCWIKPKSGFDLAQQNKILQLIKEAAFNTIPVKEQRALEKELETISKTHEGLICEPIFVESDSLIIDTEKEIMPEIRKKFPGAILHSSILIAEKEITKAL